MLALGWLQPDEVKMQSLAFLLARLVALHFTPVSESASDSFGLA